MRVFNRKPRGAPHTYNHSKTWIFDDEFAIIGSANCDRRGWTHSSEVIAGICDNLDSQTCCGFNFAHRLRIKLWAEHLNMKSQAGYAELADGVASAIHWLWPPENAPIEPYNEYEVIGIVDELGDPSWDTVFDPDGS